MITIARPNLPHFLEEESEDELILDDSCGCPTPSSSSVAVSNNVSHHHHHHLHHSLKSPSIRPSKTPYSSLLHHHHHRASLESDDELLIDDDGPFWMNTVVPLKKEEDGSVFYNNNINNNDRRELELCVRSPSAVRRFRFDYDPTKDTPHSVANEIITFLKIPTRQAKEATIATSNHITNLLQNPIHTSAMTTAGIYQHQQPFSDRIIPDHFFSDYLSQYPMGSHFQTMT